MAHLQLRPRQPRLRLPPPGGPQGALHDRHRRSQLREGPAFLYRGEAEVAYVGEETRAGVLCRKYRIDGPGLQNRGGFLWINRAEGHVEDIEIDLPDNPAWKTFKFRLTGVETMDQAAWESFQKAKIQPAQ